MNSDYQDEPGGSTSNYNPSARRSIHSYSSNEMGRYGLESKNKNTRGKSPEQGFDEVDNVQSKMGRQMSPLSIRKKKLPRRNSYSQDEENTSDDNFNVLSKSLPSNLPSHLYYSDEQEEINHSAASKSRLEDSQHSQTLNWSNDSRQQRSPYQPNLHLSSSSAQEQSKSNSQVYIIITFVIVILAMMYGYPSILKTQDQHDQTTQTDNYGEILFENNMNNLQEKYNIDSDSILKLKSGISTIFSRMDVGSFVFVYNSDTNNFNSLQFDKFINEVAYTAARYLRNNIPAIKHTVMSSDLDMQDHGELISRYQDAVDKTGVLLVKEVDRIPSHLAMAFHYYCDEYNPYVKRSAVFFTLDLANCSNTGEKRSTHDYIEKCLAAKWKTVSEENMRPLLTRVVNVIIDMSRVF